MQDVLIDVHNRSGAVSRAAWIDLLGAYGYRPKQGNWTFGRRVPFMRRDGDLYCLTAAGYEWATR